MRLLIDVDAMCKLAHWNLLSELPQLTGVAWASSSSLASLKYRALKAQSKLDGRLFRSPEAAAEVVRVVALMPQLLQPSTEMLPEFQDISGIDAGEAVLLSALASAPDTMLLTGDKRAVRALAGMDGGVRKGFSRRIVPVELVILGALDQFGLEWLRARVCPWKAIDVAVSVVMGSRCDASEASVRQALTAYLGELTALCDPSLILENLPAA